MKEAAIGIVYNPAGDQILLVKRRDIPVWVFPGGGIDSGESPEEAVIREVKEETGSRVEVQRLAARLTPVNFITQKTHLFECRWLGGELQTSAESQEVQFFSLDQLPKHLFILHKEWLEWVTASPEETIVTTLHTVTWMRTLKYFLSHPLWGLRYVWTRFVR